MNTYVLVGLLAGIGVVVGLIGGFAGRNKNPTRSQIFVGCVMLLAAALEIYIAATGTKHPLVNAAVAALLGAVGVAILVRNRHRSTIAKS